MRFLIFAFAITVFASCNSSSAPAPPPPEADIDLSGFELENLPNTDLQRAARYDGNGKLVEEGMLRNGKKHGQWVTYHSTKDLNRIKTLTHYFDGRKTGIHLEMNARGQMEGKAGYLNDQYHGVVAKYKFGRPEEEASYKNGQLHGKFRKYYQRGEVQQEAEFKEGKQHGLFRYFDEEGNVTLQYEYKNGEKVSGGIIEN